MTEVMELKVMKIIRSMENKSTENDALKEVKNIGILKQQEKDVQESSVLGSSVELGVATKRVQ